MPDQYGFNHLGNASPAVACMEQGCDARGPLHEWPERKRKAHWRGHSKTRADRLRDQAEAKRLLAAADSANSEHEEDGMASTTAPEITYTDEQAAQIAELDGIMEANKDKAAAYRNARSAAKVAKEGGDDAEVEKQGKILAKNAKGQAAWRKAYNAKLKIQKQAAAGETPEAEGEQS
jgi:hypothetical protein